MVKWTRFTQESKSFKSETAARRFARRMADQTGRPTYMTQVPFVGFLVTQHSPMLHSYGVGTIFNPGKGVLPRRSKFREQ